MTDMTLTLDALIDKRVETEEERLAIWLAEVQTLEPTPFTKGRRVELAEFIHVVKESLNTWYSIKLQRHELADIVKLEAARKRQELIMTRLRANLHEHDHTTEEN